MFETGKDTMSRLEFLGNYLLVFYTLSYDVYTRDCARIIRGKGGDMLRTEVIYEMFHILNCGYEIK